MLLCKLCSTDEYRVCCDGCFDASSSIGLVPTVLLLRRVDAVPVSEGSESSGGGGSRLTLKPGRTGKVLLPIGGLCTAHEGRGGALGERITAGEVGRRRFNGDAGRGAGDCLPGRAGTIGTSGAGDCLGRGPWGAKLLSPWGPSIGAGVGNFNLRPSHRSVSARDSSWRWSLRCSMVHCDLRGGCGDWRLGSVAGDINLGSVGSGRFGGGGARARAGLRPPASGRTVGRGWTSRTLDIFGGATSRTVGIGFTSTGFLSLVLTTVVFVRLMNSGTRLSRSGNGLTGFGRLGISGGSGLCAPACAGPCTLWCSASFRRCSS